MCDPPFGSMPMRKEMLVLMGPTSNKLSAELCEESVEVIATRENIKTSSSSSIILHLSFLAIVSS
jgi:hypothetical protein